MNIKRILRNLRNFFVPTPATVRKHRAPSARFATLEAVAAINGERLTRNGRGYVLTSADLASVIEFDNLAQVKAYLGEKTGLVAAPDNSLVVGHPDNGYDNSCLGYRASVNNLSGKENVTFGPPAEVFVGNPDAPFVPVSLSPIGSHVAPSTDINRD